MRVLIVGGQGFIGSTLANELRYRGHSVSIAGRNPTKDSVTGAQGAIHWDATEEWALPVPEFDSVVHLASANGSGSLNSLETFKNNMAVTRNVIELCKKMHASSLMYVSTFQVLGRWSGVINNQTLAQPSTDYGFCHFVAEEQARMFARNHGRGLLVIRPSNVIGVSANPGVVRWDMVPAEFCRQAVVDGRILLQSSGRQHRDFLSVQDAAERLASLIEVHYVWDSSTQLLGSGTSVEVLAAAEMVADSAARFIGKQVKIERRHDKSASDSSSLKLNLMPSSFQGVSLVAPAKRSLASVIDGLVLSAKEIFGG